LAIALSSFKYSDGKTETFKFALTPELVPTVTFTGSDQKQTLYTWDVATSHIATEQGPNGNWTYHIGDITQDFGQPPISRSSPDGKTEGMAVDNKMGIYTARDINGTTTVTHVFETPGLLYHKVKSIETTSNGVTSTIYKASYDEAGNLIRKIDENNIITAYKYDATGNQLIEKVGLSTDPAVLVALAKQEKVLLERLKQYPQGSTQRMGVLNDLVIFYICKALDFNKAKALEGLMTDRDEIYNLKLFLATCDPSHTAEQRNSMLAELVKEYPDKKDYTENLVIK
jgi:YD repeat-containing protein